MSGLKTSEIILIATSEYESTNNICIAYFYILGTKILIPVLSAGFAVLSGATC
jgi:hypothetical protein